MKELLILGVITLIIYLIINNYKIMEGITPEKKRIDDMQYKYWKGREFPHLFDGDELNMLPKLNMGMIEKFSNKIVEGNTGYGLKNLSVKNVGGYNKKSEIDRRVKLCEEINTEKNCDLLDQSDARKYCGYCFSEKEDRFMYGNKDGPTLNVCPGPKSNWIFGDDKGLNVVDRCRRKREQWLCSSIKTCGDSVGKKSICGWCPTSGKGIVMKNDINSGGFKPKYSEDTCSWSGVLNGRRTSLVHVNDCKAFEQQFPCMRAETWETGPHTKACLNDLWKKAGCSGNLNNQIPKSGMNLTSELKKFNSTSWANTQGIMDGYHKKATKSGVDGSNSYEDAKKYRMACLGETTHPCQVPSGMRWKERSIECDKKTWEDRTNCPKNKGTLNPSLKSKNVKFKKYYDSKYPNKEDTKYSAEDKIKKWFTGLQQYLDGCTLNNHKTSIATKCVEKYKGCHGKTSVRDYPYDKPCWKDQILKYNGVPTVETGVVDQLDFSKARMWHGLLKQGSRVDANQDPLWTSIPGKGNYYLRKITYELPDFPFWEFDMKYNEYKLSKWNKFVRAMLTNPGIESSYHRGRPCLIIKKWSRFAKILPVNSKDYIKEYENEKDKNRKPARPALFNNNKSEVILSKVLYASFNFPYTTYLNMAEN